MAGFPVFTCKYYPQSSLSLRLKACGSFSKESGNESQLSEEEVLAVVILSPVGASWALPPALPSLSH